MAAATYLKNFTRRNIDGGGPDSKVSKEFKDQLLLALLQVEPAVLKVLVEVVLPLLVSHVQILFASSFSLNMCACNVFPVQDYCCC